MNNISKYLINNTTDNSLRDAGVPQTIYELIYQNGAPWEIGEHQPSIEKLESEGQLYSPILDIGCGYGANSYFLATKGYEVCGIDYLKSVIEVAQKNYQHKNLNFLIKNALNLNEYLSSFNTIIDSATFHGFSDQQRIDYATHLQKYLRPGTILHVIGFSDRETREGGPRRLSQSVFEECFNNGWVILNTQYVPYKTTLFKNDATAILCSIQRV